MEVQQSQIKNEVLTFFIKAIRAENFILGDHRAHWHATAMTLKKIKYLTMFNCP